MRRIGQIVVSGIVVVLLYGGQAMALVPKASGDYVGAITTLISGDVATGDGFTDQYNAQAESYSAGCKDIGAAISSGIMNWDTIYCYGLFVVKTLRNLSLVIAAAMIIYAGYLYATGVYTGNASKGNSAITKAIIGMIVLSFALTIVSLAMRLGGFG